MFTSKALIIALAMGSATTTAGAQCAIKDKIISEAEASSMSAHSHDQPDGVTGATSRHDTEAGGRGKRSCSPPSPDDQFQRFRVGGYGEAVAAFKDYGKNRFFGGLQGNSKERRATIAIPRFVLALDYKFSPRWVLGAEVEFEAGGTGQAVELENTENGEYETEIEKGGEVAIEQFYIARLIHPAFNLRAGHMVVPVGLTNAHHEPINFFGTVRPEGETTILPSTWHETGIAAYGSFGSRMAKFNYQAMIVAGLNANGFDRNTWVASGKQGYFEEDNFNSPGYVARLDWVGVKGLRVGVSYYYCRDASKNADKSSAYGNMGRASVNIFTADAQYTDRYLTARANIVHGRLGNSEGVSHYNVKQPNQSPYSRLAPVAENAVSYAGEVGLNLRGIFGLPRAYELLPFVRYEYYNPQEKVVGLQVADLRLKTSMWTMGMNYRVGNGVVLKADYTARTIGGGRYHSENEFALGVAFNTWFFTR